MAAALEAPERALQAWQTWTRSGADARIDPVALRWLPLIGWNLRHTAIDQATVRVFQEARRGIWASNVRIIDAARPAIQALHAAGLRTILLKGAALSHAVYEAPGLRPIGDVDLLIEPGSASLAQRVLFDLGWTSLRDTHPQDRLLAHGLDLRKPPHGALDVHWFLLHECGWPSADRGVWRRAVPFPSWGPLALTLAPGDQLLHVCLHGLRWSPVHAGHWVADAVRIIAHAGGGLDWDVVVNEARARRMALQMAEALRVVRHRGRAQVPEHVLDALGQERPSWLERRECRLKGRPVVSPGGLFVIWAGWRRTRHAALAEGEPPPPWSRYLAAALGVPSPAAVAGRFLTHIWRGTAGAFSRGPRRGATTRERLPASHHLP